MRPGQTAFTRMAGASARASDSVIAFSAPFDAMYGTDEPSPSRPAIDDTFTMAPEPAACIAGVHARIIW